MAFDVEGIILKGFNYGEHHKIIKVLTEKIGVIGVFVQNANKVNTKKSALVQPLTCARFNLKPSTHAKFSNGEQRRKIKTLIPMLTRIGTRVFPAVPPYLQKERPSTTLLNMLRSSILLELDFWLSPPQTRFKSTTSKILLSIIA